MSAARKKRSYARITKAERRSIERALGRGESARSIAGALGRSPSSISDEVRGHRVQAEPRGDCDRPCDRLSRWPWVCDGCPMPGDLGCGRAVTYAYRASDAQAESERVRSESRRGADAREEDFLVIASEIHSDLLRGLSPSQIAAGRSSEFSVSPSTIYRWIDEGYDGMSAPGLRRKVGYKKRRAPAPGDRQGREGVSHRDFLELPEGERDAACETGTVLGRRGDRTRLPALLPGPCRSRLALPLPDGTCGSVVAELDRLERAVGAPAFARLFPVVLTDNGVEFADAGALSRSCLGGGGRFRLFYCDPYRPRQKGACEKNHVEPGKVLPKGRGGTSLDGLTREDCAWVMGQADSLPRPSLMGPGPIAMLRAAAGADADALLGALGVSEVPYEGLDLTPGGLDRDRERRGLPPLR